MYNRVQTADSLIANEFAFEIDGEEVSGVFRIANLTTFKCDDEGNRLKPPFMVAKMVERDGNNRFNTWLRETLAHRDSTERPRRSVTVVAVDDGVVTRRWQAKGAWIAEVSYSDFDSSDFEMVAEIYTIMYDDIEETWPVTDSAE